ncbi:MAG TPA: hypothetical protein VHB25_12145 [Gemmatimonadaceae bacterium]|nr:hypothetical protein [Gemmatimonadaceae bacterium]
MAPSPTSAEDTLGDRLTQAMKRAKLKNPEVAAAAGVHAVTVSRWRTDAQQPEERQLEAVVRLLNERGVAVSVSYLRYGPSSRGHEGSRVPAGNATPPAEAELPRRLELLALDFERAMVQADVDADFRRYARARLRDPELLEMYAGGHSDRAMTADEQLADYEDLIDELRGRLKRRLALLKKRGAK